MIPAIIGAGGAILSTALTNSANSRNARNAFAREQAYNTWLMRNETQMRVKDLRSAGLNPAFMNGSQMGSSSGSPSYDTPQMSSPVDLSSAMMFGQTIANTQNLHANTRKTLADARAQELLNKDKEQRNKILGAENVEVPYDDNGVKIDDLDKWVADHPNQVPDTIVVRQVGQDGGEGKFNAHQMLQRWQGEVEQINASMVANQLESMVAKGQMSNPFVCQSLIQMPFQTFRKLVQDTQNAMKQGENLTKQGRILDIEAVTKQLEQDITRDTNLTQYVEKAFGGDFSMKDLAKLLVLAAVACLRK